MKIKITRSVFLEGLTKVQNIVASKGTLQIIQNVLIEANDNQLILTTTDLDISIRSTVPCEVIVPGTTTLPVKLLSVTISKAAEGSIEIETDANDRAEIKAGTANFKIAGLNAADFPRLPADSESFPYVLPQILLRDMLRKTAYAAAVDDSRKSLRGVLMRFSVGKLTMVGADGRRLALINHEVDVPEDAQRDIVLPVKVVAELQRVLSNEGEVRITVEGSQVSFNLGETQIYSKKLDDVYPNFELVIPKSCSLRATLDRKMLMDALSRVSVMALGQTNSARLKFESNNLIVSSDAVEVGNARDAFPIKYDGEPIEIVFNPQYVMDPLKAIDDDEIYIEMNNNSSPAMLKCLNSETFIYVMMPLRIA